MEYRSKDPYCDYLFKNDRDKTMLLIRHDSDVASYYGKHTGIETEKFFSGAALPEILKNVFTHKKFRKAVKNDEENESFYTNNCKLLEKETGADNFDGEHYFAIVTNFLSIINQGMLPSVSEEKSNHDDFHIRPVETAQKIREIFGMRWRSLDGLVFHYTLKKILICLFLLILILSIAAVGLCFVDWYHVIDFSQKYTIMAPLAARMETGLLQFTALLGAADLYQSSLMLIFGSVLLILLLVITIFTAVRIWKAEKMEYKIHYLSRIVGVSSQKLREIGWL